MRSLPADHASRAAIAPWRLVPLEWQHAAWRFRPVAAVQAMLAVLVVAQLGRIPFLTSGERQAPILVNDFAVLAVLAIGALGAVLARSFRIDRVGGLGLLFAAVGAFSALLAIPRYGLSAQDLVISLAYLARWLVYFLLYLVVINVVRAGDVPRVWRTIEKTVLAFAAFGLFQAAFLPHFAQLVYPDAGGANEWDQQGHRLVSTVLDPNIAGAMIMLVLLVQAAQLSTGARRSALEPAVLFAALVATLSRSSLIGLFVGGVILISIHGVSRRLLRFGAVLGVLFLASLPKIIQFAQGYNKLAIDGSALTRVTQWIRALRIFSDHPLFGIGFNTYAFVQERYGWERLGRGSYALDGGLLFIAVMTGLVGLALYVGMISVIVSRCRRIWRDVAASAERRALAAGIGAASVAICVQSLFVNSLLTAFVMELLWVMWGLVFVMAASSSRQAVRPVRASRAGALRVAGMAALLFTATACDPCSGVASCRPERALDISGQIIERRSLAPVANADVTVSVLNGSTPATLSARTDANGLWRITAPVAEAMDTARLDVSVKAPGAKGYTVRNVPVRTTSRGDAVELGQWLSAPASWILLGLVHKGVDLAGAKVAYATTSGIVLTFAPDGVVSNASGIIEVHIEADEVGTSVGTLTVTHPSLPAPSRLTNVALEVGYRYTLPKPIGTIALGPRLAQAGRVIYRGTHQSIPGAQVTFTRTGGIAIQPSVVTVTTDASGYFVLPLASEQTGTVTGDLVIAPPNGARGATYRNVQFATYEALQIRDSGLWAYGEQWAWAIELWSHDLLKPAPGVHAVFERTGGVNITPATLDLVADANGRIELKAAVTDTGFVDGRLTVYPAAGAPRVINNVRLRTFESDETRFAGVFGFGPALRYALEVLRSDGTRVAGAAVQWTQTSGAAATPFTITLTTDAQGRATLVLVPSADGTVTGTVRITPPAPWPVGTTFTNTLALATFESGEVRLGGVFRIPPP